MSLRDECGFVFLNRRVGQVGFGWFISDIKLFSLDSHAPDNQSSVDIVSLRKRFSKILKHRNAEFINCADY